MWLIELVLLNSANLICRSTDILKFFRESLRIRDNESRLFLVDRTCNSGWPLRTHMPYLTVWDKSHRIWPIWKAILIKKFRSHRIFNPFYEEISINHTQFWFSQASDMKKKDFRPYWRSSKVMFKKISQNFVEFPLKFCLISQILVHSLWHVCTKQPLVSFKKRWIYYI